MSNSADKKLKQKKMKEVILNILKQYKENVSLSEGHFDYMIWGDDEILEEIAQQVEKEIKKSLCN